MLSTESRRQQFVHEQVHDVIWVSGKLKGAPREERSQHALAMASEPANGGAKPAQARITQLAAENERLRLLVWPRLCRQ